jgi:colanic acid/amylovoran biosynthesis glycosyltransferase
MPKKLIYFTASFPYGIGEQWKANELNELINYFKEITVIPYSYAGNKHHPKSVDKSIVVEKPLFDDERNIISIFQLAKILLHKKAPYFLVEFFSKKVYTKKKWFISWSNASLTAIKLLKHPTIKEIIQSGDKHTVLYFYWGRGSAEILPFINTKVFNKVFLRLHGYDLFEYRNNFYIPYRKQQLNAVTVAAPISIAGLNHLKQLYPTTNALIKVFRCGTLGNNKLTQSSQDKTLRVVSCSFLLLLKRIHIMIQATALVDFPIKWVHIGGGDLFDELALLIKQNNLQDKFILLGEMDSRKIIDYYTNNQFDVFVNTSSTEGVPISIMEAFATSIPVIATDVGGTSEIVNNEVGELIESDITPSSLAASLTRFYHLSEQRKQELKNNAYQVYLNKCHAKTLAKELAEYLIQ